jgi:hypothetical protein
VLTIFALAILQLTSPSPQTTPYRSPQVAASQNLAAVAFGSGHALYVAVSNDQGNTFASPVKIAEAEILPLSRHRGPRIAVTNNAIVVTAVTGVTEATGPHSHGLPSDGDLFAWRSTDSGKTWSKGARINDIPSAAREGLHALASDEKGNLFAVWLDLRNGGTQLYGSLSHDSGATWSPNRLVYKSPSGTICQCCHPSASFSSNGTIEVMWRNCVDDARDFYLVHSRDGKKFGKPEKLGQGTWKINACPMDGGGLTHIGTRTITAWRREANIYLAEPGKPETMLGEGKDVAIAANNDQLYLLWIAHSHLELWTNGTTRSLSDNAAFPSITALPDGEVLGAWEENGSISIQKLH